MQTDFEIFQFHKLEMKEALMQYNMFSLSDKNILCI